jgi:hypothetical protein
VKVNNAVSKLLFLSLSLEAEFVSLSRKMGGWKEREKREEQQEEVENE